MTYFTKNTIYKKEEHYSSFPSITSDGFSLYLVFRQAGKFSNNCAQNGTPVHHDNDSKVLFMSSDDQGETWSEPLTIFEGRYGVNDPAITIAKNKKIYVRFTEIEVKPSIDRPNIEGQLLNHRSDLGQVSAIYQNSLIESNDLGITWSKSLKISVDHLSSFISRDPIVELQDGTFILSVYTSSPFKSEKAFLIRSWDSCKTWTDVSLIAQDFSPYDSLYSCSNFNESAITELSENTLMALIRNDNSYFTNNGEDYMHVGGVGNIYQSFSYNNGLSWSVPKNTNLFGQPIAAAKVKPNTIIAVYAVRKIPYKIVLRISNNNGLNWGDEIIVADQIEHWDFGYPSITIIENKIFVAYYLQDCNGIRFIELSTLDFEEISNL